MFSADSNRTAQEPRIQGFVWSNKHCKCLICAGRDADFSGHEHVQEAPSADRQAAAGLQEERSQVSVDSWRKRAPTPTRSVGRAGDRPREEVTPTRRGSHSVQPGSSVSQREGAPTLRAGHRAMRHAEFVQAGMGKG